MSGAIFNLATPWFVHEARRWDEDDASAMIGQLGDAVPPGAKLLDIGGGTGRLASLIAGVARCEVTVLDASARMLRHARGLAGVVAVQGDATCMPFDDNAFDAAIIVDALHHVAAQADLAREVARVVRQHGAVLVADPDMSVAAVRASAALERFLGEPALMLTPEDVVRLFGAAGVPGQVTNRTDTGYVFVGRIDR